MFYEVNLTKNLEITFCFDKFLKLVHPCQDMLEFSQKAPESTRAPYTCTYTVHPKGFYIGYNLLKHGTQIAVIFETFVEFSNRF